MILPETISEEPLGPVVPHGDDKWFDVVKTVMAILIYSEAYGVAMDNVPSTATGDVKVDRLFGLEGAENSYGQEALGISNTAAQDVIRGVGNYGEIMIATWGPRASTCRVRMAATRCGPALRAATAPRAARFTLRHCGNPTATYSAS